MQQNVIRRDRSRRRRVFRVRNKLRGTALRPRLSVHKSNQHVYVQLIDDDAGVTLAGIGTQSEANAKGKFNRKSRESARHLGTQIAALAKEKNVNEVIFDRGRYKFHGVIAEVATAAREAGLKI